MSIERSPSVFVPHLEPYVIDWEDIADHQPRKVFGDLIVHDDEPVPADCCDDNDARMAKVPLGDSSQILLHVDDWPGVHTFRQDLANSALYIASHDVLFRRSFVIGPTFEGFARRACRVGFRRMATQNHTDHYLENLELMLKGSYSNYTHSEERFKPAFVYLPTRAFVALYAPSPQRWKEWPRSLEEQELLYSSSGDQIDPNYNIYNTQVLDIDWGQPRWQWRLRNKLGIPSRYKL